MIKKTVVALSGLTLVTGCITMAPKDVTEADLAAFDAAVASVGCELVGERQYQPVELQTGLPREKIVEIASYKLGTEEVVSLENGGVRLVTGQCAPQVEPAPAAAT